MADSVRGTRVRLMCALVGLVLGGLGIAPSVACASIAWVPQTSGTKADLCAVSFADANDGWAVGYSGTILHTADGGGTWTPQSSGTPSATLESVAFPDATHGWAVGTGGTIISTTDGGAYWAAQSSETPEALSCVAFPDATHGWAVGQGGTILSTADAGAHWAAQTSGTGEWLTSTAFVDAAHGWAVGDWGVFLATSDGGVHWTQQDSGIEGTHCEFLGVAFADAMHGCAVGTMGHIRGTTDGGAHWTAQSSDVAQSPFTMVRSSCAMMDIRSVAFSDATHAWAVGDMGTIISTSDGGAHWMARASGTGNTLLGIFARGSNSVWAVGESGTILTISSVATDTTPPVTAIVGVSGGGAYSSPAMFTFAAADNPGGTGVATTFYSLDGAPATMYMGPVALAAVGPHTVSYWSVDGDGNAESAHVVTFTVAAAVAQSTSITIRATATTTAIGRTPILSGTVGPAACIGQNMVVYVMKPGSSRWTYSSNRTVYALGSGAAWQYKYTFKKGMTKGVYKFKAVMSAWPGYLSSTSPTTVSIRLK